MVYLRPKKSLGQHFLTDANIARKIVNSLPSDTVNILEIGPGKGILTKFILSNKDWNAYFIETDKKLIEYLTNHYPDIKTKIICDDFLIFDLNRLSPGKFSIIGNLPYNISSQIFFKILEHREKINNLVVMLQKEVAERISSPPGNKKYGILSVLLQAFYDIEYLFTVHEHVFFPPPKVKSAVIRLSRNQVRELDCDEKNFKRVVKAAFNQRRKTLRNSLKQIEIDTSNLPEELLSKRAEQLCVDDFVLIANNQ